VKKIIFYLLGILFTLTFFLMLDFILSNTILTKKNCYSFQEFFYELKKNCIGKDRFKSSFPTVSIYTDNMGLRVSKNYFKKDASKKNILIFGDSFTFGVGLENEDTYPSLIEKKLSNFNVYNYGVGSYSPTVHLFKLKKAIANGVAPDKILLFLDLTDVIDEATRWNYDQKNEKPFLTNSIIYDKNKKKYFKSKNFKLLKEFSSVLNFNTRIIRSKIKNSFKKTSKSHNVKQSIQGSFTYVNKNNLDKRFWKENDFDLGIKKIKTNFEEIINISKKNNSDLYLIIYPWAETVEFGQNEFSWSNFGKELCLKESCVLIDAIPDFVKYKKNNKNWINQLYFVNDEHFNAQGDKLLSDIVIKKLNK
jgi:lysophospholipase L1-like esterase